MKNQAVGLSVSIGFALVACQSPANVPKPQENDVPLGALHAGPETALQSTIERTHFAFRSDGTGFRAGHSTHDAFVANGTLAFTPRNWDGSRVVSGMPITLQTRSISRGDVELDSTLLASEVSDGAVKLTRQSTEEQFANLPEGIEQSWQFASAPEGDGDLAVRIAVTGFSKTATTQTGLHFYTPGQLGIRYTTAVWRDSSGEAWEVPTTWDGDNIVITVPQHLIEASKFPATLDPTVGSENQLDSLATGFTDQQAQQLAVAWSGTQWLVVWRDDRNGTASDIFGTRVQTDGTVSDKYGLAIHTGTTTETNPAVAWVGTKWVVAWNSGGDIQAATVTTTDAVAQLGTVAGTTANEQLPAIAAIGSQAVLVWQSDFDIRGALFSAGAFGAPFDIAVTADNEIGPSLAANPAGGYLVSYGDSTATDLEGHLLNSNGTLNGAVFAISAGAGTQDSPSSTWNGTNYVVSFTNKSTDIYATRVSPAGVVLDTHLESTTTVGGVPITTQTGSQVHSGVACDPSDCFIVWGDGRAIATNGSDIYGQLVDFNMALVGTEVAVANPTRTQANPAIATSTSGYLAVWEDSRSGGALAATAARIASAGTVTDASGIVLTRGYNWEVTPRFGASPSSGGLLVWSDSRSYGNDIEGIRFSSSLGALEGTAKVVSSSNGEQADESVSFNGTNYLVVWRDGRNATDDIYASRFDYSSGAALDPGGIAISTAADRQLVPDVASGGGVSLVVWQDRRNSATTGFDIYGALVTPTGTIQLNDIVICNATGDQVRPAITFDPADNVFVVVWSDQRVTGNSDIYGARIDTSGNVLDANGVLISGAANGQLSPDVAASGTQLLAVWDDRRTETNGDVYGARFTASGSLTVLDANGIAIAATAGSQQREPTVTATQNGRWVVAWTDDTNTATTKRDILGVDIQTNGTVGTPFTIANSTDDEHTPAFQNDPNSSLKIMITYGKLRSDIDTQRVYRRTLTYSGDTGSACTMNSQCSSGFCVDSYCCDQACGGTQLQYPKDCQACSIAHGGTANGTCTTVVAGTLCRWYDSGTSSDTFCDVTEKCDGTSTVCPPDLGRNQGLTCTGVCGSGHCPANDTTGAPHVCTCP